MNHTDEVPFRLLDRVPEASVGDGGTPSGNVIVHGDNLEALKALLPYYRERVKLVFIDPPYNTGNENWVYNDRMNAPKIKEWLGRVVGGEGEDLSRHDKWLCMMYPRLTLLRDLLAPNGSLWMTIDDNEAHYAKVLMDEVFGRDNFIASVIWQKVFSPKNTAKSRLLEGEVQPGPHRLHGKREGSSARVQRRRPRHQRGFALQGEARRRLGGSGPRPPLLQDGHPRQHAEHPERGGEL